MKKLLLTLALTFGATLLAQTEAKSAKNSTPVKVTQAFAKEFPNKKAKWEKEYGNYEAEFKLNGTDASAVYDANGNRKELEIEIPIKDLQPAIVAYLQKNYATYKITEAAKITDHKNVVTYEAEIKKGKDSFDVLFTQDGKFIKATKEEENTKED